MTRARDLANIDGLLTAKGDIYAATAAATPDRLAVGNNGETIVADSSTATGLSYQANWAAGKNRIINGDFRFNQRSFTSNSTDNTYNFDRFVQANGGTTGTLTITPQTFTPGTAPVAGYEAINYVQCVTAAGASTNTFALYNQYIEDTRTFAGQTVTLSFWAKAASGTPKIATEIGQNFGSGGSPSAAVYTAGGSVTLTTSWARYSTTITVPSVAGKTFGTTANTSYLAASLWLSSGSTFNTRSSSIGLQNATFQIWGVQLEAGSTATAFQTATGTIQGELAACQRYYQRLDAANNAAQMAIGPAWAFNANGADMVYKLTTEMRVPPTVLDYSSLSHFQWQGITVNSVPTSIVYDTNINSRYNAGVTFNKTGGYTSGGNYFILVNTSSAYIGFGAEL